jgi:hypothetical protein
MRLSTEELHGDRDQVLKLRHEFQQLNGELCPAYCTELENPTLQRRLDLKHFKKLQNTIEIK